MTGYVKYFENGRKNISLMIEDDRVLVKCNDIQNRIKKMFSIKFHSMPVYDEKFIKVIFGVMKYQKVCTALV